MPLTIIEIIKPAEQGLSTPFLCRGDDDALYFVKGRNSGRASQWAEWLAGHVGRAFGLPIPPFCLAQVPANLVRECPAELRPIGAGIAFASRQREAAQWLEPAAIGRVPVSLRRDVLVFDWWIRNLDRTRGNPNLLWAPASEELVVIDHNQAFDPDFSASDFLANHLFSADAEAVFSDLVEQARYLERIERALEVWDSACDNAPPEWRWANDEQDVPANFDPDAARAVLACCSTPYFWRRP
ncbi:MAG: hypothetical protein Q8Q28_02990 [Pseudomonadota bacterium]|nr:hypothetical protein [Pseudomonadota bacterium]